MGQRLTLRLPNDLLEQLQFLAAAHGMNLSDIARTALVEYCRTAQVPAALSPAPHSCIKAIVGRCHPKAQQRLAAIEDQVALSVEDQVIILINGSVLQEDETLAETDVRSQRPGEAK